jgi:hypothetical protein
MTLLLSLPNKIEALVMTIAITRVFVFIHSVGAPTIDKLLENVAVATELDGDFESLWNQFAHEFDWRLAGPGRVRLQNESGDSFWR